MSTAIDFTGFKGETGLTGDTGLSIHSGVGTPTTVAGSNNGDLYLDTTGTETDAGRIFKRIDAGNVETWVFQYDLSGAKGDTPVFGTPTASTVAVGGTPTVTQSGTDLAPVLVFGLVTGATGATGDSGASLAGTLILTTRTLGTTVSIDVGSNGSTSGALQRSTFVFDTNKYTTDVGTEVNANARTTLRFFSRDRAETGFGFSGTGNDFERYQNFDVANNPFNGENLIDALVAQVQAGNTSVFQNGAANDAVWQISFTKTSATTGFFTGPANADLTATIDADTLGFTGATLAGVDINVLVEGQTFVTGSLILYDGAFYGCTLGYSSTDNDNTPDTNTVNWAVLG